jgi:ribose-phosphate pyrophosphokinase
MNLIIFPLPGNEALAKTLAQHLKAQLGTLTVHQFPDGEVLVRIDTPVTDKDVVFVCTLDHPDSKLLPIVFAADLARELGAPRTGLVSPYLSYMRQDKRFHAGEAITSKSFARLLSSHLDFLITADPHLHRYTSLDEIYSLRTKTVQAAPAIAAWIKNNVVNPLLIGPDSESVQWVEAIAKLAGAPHTVLEKVRHSDSDVQVSLPQLAHWHSHTPVLVDDIISTARTMIEVVHHLKQQHFTSVLCIGVHAIFANDAYQDLLNAGATRIATCNTIYHASNQIDIHPLFAAALTDLLGES